MKQMMTLKAAKQVQILMEFLRCTETLKSGKRCNYSARYADRCGHHKKLWGEKVVKPLPEAQRSKS